MARKPLSKRGAERRALQELYQTATYAGLTDLLDIGKLNLADVRKYYTDARAKAVKRIARIAESDVPWTDEPPEFLKTSELTDDADLLKAVGEINKFLLRPTTVKERRAAYAELLEDLHGKGLTFLNMSNIGDWDRFRKWVRAKGLLSIRYVDNTLLGDLFTESTKKGKANSEYWSEQWEELKAILGAKSGRKRVTTKKTVKLNRKRGK